MQTHADPEEEYLHNEWNVSWRLEHIVRCRSNNFFTQKFIIFDAKTNVNGDPQALTKPA